MFPPKWQGEARGLPTAWAVPPLADQLVWSENNVPVWADSEGKVRGIALEPLHRLSQMQSVEISSCMNLENLKMLEQAIEHLEPLLNEVVFVGGATVELWVTDEAAPEFRPTRTSM